MWLCPTPKRSCRFQLETLEDKIALSGGSQGLGVALMHIPTDHGQGSAVVQTLQGVATDPAARHRQDGVHRSPRAHGGQGAAQGAVNGLNQASAILTRIVSSGPAAAQRGLNRALSAVQKAAAKLDGALGSASTSGQDAAKAALQRALSNLDQLDGKVPADRLASIRTTLQDALAQIP
jgi:hypothetical protein